MASNYPRGSKWRKWDLHVHTPESFHWNGGKRFPEMTPEEAEQEIKNILEQINNSDIAVYAMVDYWTFEGYIRIKEYIEANPNSLSDEKLILPGIELRIEAPVNYRLNVQVILADELSTQTLRDFRQKLEIHSIGRSISDEALRQFAQSLSLDKAQHHGHPDYKDNDNSALLLGSKTAEITKDSLEAAIASLPSRDRCLVVMPWDTSDGLVDLDWSAHPQSANYFLQLPDVFESRKQRVKDLFNGVKTEQNEAFFDNFYSSLGCKQKPVVCGSDAHKISDYGEFPGSKNTWIKSDPTYEGLRQIIYEPKDRVIIQENSPEFDYLKNCFDSFEINGNLIAGEELQFCDAEILLNRDLVTIIGGRGTGKSILLDCLLKILSPSRSSEDRVDDLEPAKFNVKLGLGDGEEPQTFAIQDGERFDYLHVRQGDIKEKVRTAASLSDSIKTMLNIVEEDYSESVDDKIYDALSLFHRASDFLDERNEENKPLHDLRVIDLKIESISKLIQTLTTESNQKLVDEYREINLNIENTNILVNRIKVLEEGISEKVDSINQQLDSLNELDQIQPKVRKIDSNNTSSDLKTNVEQLITQKNTLEERRKQIKESFSAQGVNQDIGGLLDKVGYYQSQIQKLEDLKERVRNAIREREIQASITINSVNTRIDSLVVKAKEIEDGFQGLKSGREGWSHDQIQLIDDLLTDVDIIGEVDFDTKSFYAGLSRIMNGNKFKQTVTQKSSVRLKEFFNIETSNHLREMLAGVRKLTLYDETVVDVFSLSRIDEYFNASSTDLLEYLTLSKYQKNYLSVSAKVLYKGKSPEKLSVGQRGTFYLCMKLVTDPFGSPFVYDQPEDDLDNEFIVEELVPIFKKIKKYRQVIIATHNANLVVNADSEQVIVANNDEEALSYSSGSLENTEKEPNRGIRENVCRILEGGKVAFEKREKKYGINL